MLNKNDKTSVKVYENDSFVTSSGVMVMEFEYCEDWGGVFGVDTCGVLFTPELLGDELDYGFFTDLFLYPEIYNPL